MPGAAPAAVETDSRSLAFTVLLLVVMEAENTWKLSGSRRAAAAVLKASSLVLAERHSVSLVFVSVFLAVTRSTRRCSMAINWSIMDRQSNPLDNPATKLVLIDMDPPHFRPDQNQPENIS